MLNPGDVEALNNLGNALRDAGELRDAVSLYRRSIELEPRHAASHCNLGHALLELRRPDEAAASYVQALALQPGYAPAQLSLGTTLRLQGPQRRCGGLLPGRAGRRSEPRRGAVPAR